MDVARNERFSFQVVMRHEKERKQSVRALVNARNDSLCPGSSFRSWLDAERRIVRNAAGQLPTPGYDIGSRVKESI